MMERPPQSFERPAFEEIGVRGFLHLPAETAPRAGLVLVHGAGGNCQAPLMVAVAKAFAAEGFAVLRCDLPFRQERPHGPPPGVPKAALKDREGIRRAADALREITAERPLYVAGHSYGGRQATMLAAEDSRAADALLLLSYPLHAPGKPEAVRTQHFATLNTPALFVHGTRDSFGSIAEMEAALAAIPARHQLIPVDGGRHGLPPALAPSIAEWFCAFLVSDH
jgi:uncharacterized protein